MSYGKECQIIQRSHTSTRRILKEFGPELRHLIGQNPDRIKLIPQRIKREDWKESVAPRIIIENPTGRWVRLRLEAGLSSQQVSIVTKDQQSLALVQEAIRKYRLVLAKADQPGKTIALV